MFQIEVFLYDKTLLVFDEVIDFNYDDKFLAITDADKNSSLVALDSVQIVNINKDVVYEG